MGLNKENEFQYAVTIWAGRDEGTIQYVHATKQQIDNAIEKIRKCPAAYINASLYVRCEEVKLDDLAKNKIRACGFERFCFEIKPTTSIDIHVMDPRWANSAAEKLKLPLPFSKKYIEDYVKDFI